MPPLRSQEIQPGRKEKKKKKKKGSGQVIDQGARLVDIALEDGSVFSDDGFKYISESFADHTLHFIGLLSDGGVHSRTDQLFLFIRGAAERGAKKIRVHVLTDGRDVPDGSSVRFVDELEAVLKSLPEGVDGKIASGGGRMRVTMDRYEADWKIVERGWQAHVLGEAPHKFADAKTAVATLRGSGEAAVSDQWLDPFVIVDDAGKPVGTVEDGDAVVLTNFRADRVIEISKAFEYADFTAFDRVRWPKTRFVGMMQYDGDLKLPARYLVPPPAITRVSGELLAASGVSTFACSETQKFGHVTFFWNGNRSGYFNESLETYVEIPSDAVPFNEAPDMKAREITEAGKEAILSKKFKMIRINYANPDMVSCSFFSNLSFPLPFFPRSFRATHTARELLSEVAAKRREKKARRSSGNSLGSKRKKHLQNQVGHTGDLAATTGACALVDKCLGELLEVCESLGGRWLVTADHGNADDMVQRHKKSKREKKRCWREERGRWKKEGDVFSFLPFFFFSRPRQQQRLFLFSLTIFSLPPATNPPALPPPYPPAGEPMTDENGKPLPLTSHTLAPVPIAVGGAGLPADVKFRGDLPEAGLANVTATYINLLGFATPEHMVPSLI